MGWWWYAAVSRLLRQVRERFLNEDWPRILAQIERLDLKKEDLFDLA